MDWEEEPATNQQLLRLREYGFVPTFPLTVTQAARLIRQYSKRPSHAAPPEPVTSPAMARPQPAVQQSARPARQPATGSAGSFAGNAVRQAAGPVRQAPSANTDFTAAAAGERLSQGARLHGFQLRVTVQVAEKTVKENPDRPGVRADLHSAIAARQQFWFDTCRDEKDTPFLSLHAVEFHQHFGAHFFSPTWDEVGEVLDALDGAMPGWDKDHAELFYETLKLNFPSLLRHK